MQDNPQPTNNEKKGYFIMQKHRVQYQGNRTWLGKTRPVRTKKAARIFQSEETARKIANNIADMFKNDFLRDYVVVIDN